MSDPQPAVVSTAWSVAETQGLADDIDAIRHITDADADGEVVRVLLKDSPSETEKVGFQATKPPGEFGDSMFRRQLKNGLNELRRVRDGQETRQSDSTESASSDETTASAATAAGGDTTVGVQVTITDDSLAALESELADAVAATETDTTPETIAELESRIAEIETRLDRLESSLAGLSEIASE